MVELGRLIIVIGVVLIIFGALLAFGLKLPGDILVRKGNFTFFFPIVTSLVLSLVLSLIFWLLRK